jgi:hypothetical protein
MPPQSQPQASELEAKVLQKEVKLPEYYAIVHRPKLDQPQRIGYTIFSYQIDNSLVRQINNNVQTQIELGVLTLKEGCTFVPYAIWQAAMAFPQNRYEVERMQSMGAIAIFIPDSQATSNDSTDFTLISTAIGVISFCNDPRWLEKSRNRDKRIEIDKAIEQRLEELAETTKKSNQSFPMGSFV